MACNVLFVKVWFSTLYLLYSSCATACSRAGRTGLGRILRDEIFLDFMRTRPLLFCTWIWPGWNEFHTACLSSDLCEMGRSGDSVSSKTGGLLHMCYDALNQCDQIWISAEKKALFRDVSGGLIWTILVQNMPLGLFCNTNKLASLEATLVRNSAHSLTDRGEV